MVNKFFPVSIDLNHKNVLVIGAGNIAYRKIETLLKYNCNISRFPSALADPGPIYVSILVAATDNEEINKNISDLCIKKNILVNNITSKNDMNLRFMSICEKDDIQIAVSANGNPKKAVEIKNKIKELI